MFRDSTRISKQGVAIQSLITALMLGLLFGTTSQAALIGATSAPKQARVPVEEGRTLQIHWVISTTSAHSTGAFSAQGTLKDAATSTVLKTLTTPFNKTEGAGPLYFDEPLTITAEEATEWLKLGYRQLEYTRQFSTGSERPTTSEAKVIIKLGNKNANASFSGLETALAIHNLQLSYKPQRFRSQINAGLPLQAQLSVAYSGNGELKGSWQLAALDESNGKLQFKELAQVSKILRSGGRDWLLSPQLPTVTAGRYTLRFCQLQTLNATSSENLCPNPQQSASIEYQVITEEASAPPEAAPATLTATTQLNWKATEGAVVYELTLTQHSGQASITSAEYIGRLLIPGQTHRTTLSPQLLDRLLPGNSYEWQVKALDKHGDLIHQTPPARFVFMP